MLLKDNKRYLTATIIITFLAVVVNAFIIMQSCLNGFSSSRSSGMAVNLLKGIINAISPNAINDGNIDTFTHVIRKLIGHFGLFVISGLTTSTSIYLWFKPQKWYKLYRFSYASLLFGFFLASLTEFIQTFIPNRSGEFTDVLIDFSGFLLGFSLILLIIYLIFRHQKKIAN